MMFILVTCHFGMCLRLRYLDNDRRVLGKYVGIMYLQNITRAAKFIVLQI